MNKLFPRTSLLRAANAFRVTWFEQVFGRSSRIGRRNALTEKALEDALQGLGKTGSAYGGRGPTSR